VDSTGPPYRRADGPAIGSPRWLQGIYYLGMRMTLLLLLAALATGILDQVQAAGANDALPAGSVSVKLDGLRIAQDFIEDPPGEAWSRQ
jgi:hypothetical protein